MILGRALLVLYEVDLADIPGRVKHAGDLIVKPIFEFLGGHSIHFTDPGGYELAVWTEG
ncbi:hypothetical protein OAJ57_03495 [Alphaproteobacteria bacterium]|nr:hypothetical protein [Alphaproteobacteria bacterium]